MDGSMSIKFEEVYSQNKNQKLQAEMVLNDIKNHEVSAMNDRYFCPDCLKAELTYVINTQYKDPYFKTHNYSEHEEGCNLSSEPIRKELMYNHKSNNYLKDNEKYSLLQRLSLSHQQHMNHYQKNNDSVSKTDKNVEQKRHKNNSSSNTKILQRKLNKYFKKNILETLASCPENTYIPFVLYGHVNFRTAEKYGHYTNYRVCLESSEKTLFSLGLDMRHESDYIDIINNILKQEVYVVMIGWIHVKSNYINFNFMGNPSFLIE